MQNAPLSVGAYGDSVARLQKLLLQSGFQLASSEVNRTFFGPATRQVIQQFQQQNGLQVSGAVDEQTAILLQRDEGSGQPGNAPTFAASSTQLPPESPKQKTPGSPAAAPQPETPPANGVLSNATRHIEKATLVPLQVERAFDDHGRGLAIANNAFVRQLSLQPGEHH